jgi:hypothetical protein
MVIDFVIENTASYKEQKLNCFVLYVGSIDMCRLYIYIVFNGGQNFVGEKESFCDLESVN